MKIILFIITEHAEDLYTEDHKNLMERHQRRPKYRDILCSLIGKINIAKTSILFKLTYRFKVISGKISTKFLVNIDKLTLKFTWKGIGSRIAKIKFYLDKKNKVGRITLPYKY